MRRVLAIVTGAVSAVLVGFLLGALGVSPLVAALAVIVALMFVPHLYIRYWLPVRTVAVLRGLADPGAGPPKGAEPVDDGFPQRLMEAVASGSRGLEEWLAADFVMIDARGRRHSAKRYLAAQRALLNAYPDLSERIEALHADFDQPDVLWMCTTQTGHPRRGPAYDVTAWSRVTLTRDRNFIREIAVDGVVRVGD